MAELAPAPSPARPLADAELRTRIIELIQNSDGASIKRIYAKITKTKRIQQHRTCAVQSAPKSNWKPRTTAEGLRIVELLEQRVGLCTAPFQVEDNEHSAKLTLSGICQVLLRESAEGAAIDKSAKLKVASAATSLACRVIEEAHRLLREDGNADLKTIEMHGSRQSPAWAPLARGSGIVLTKGAWPLFDAALARVKDRITAA